MPHPNDEEQLYEQDYEPPHPVSFAWLFIVGACLYWVYETSQTRKDDSNKDDEDKEDKAVAALRTQQSWRRRLDLIPQLIESGELEQLLRDCLRTDTERLPFADFLEMLQFTVTDERVRDFMNEKFLDQMAELSMEVYDDARHDGSNVQLRTEMTGVWTVLGEMLSDPSVHSRLPSSISLDSLVQLLITHPYNSVIQETVTRVLDAALTEEHKKNVINVLRDEGRVEILDELANSSAREGTSWGVRLRIKRILRMLCEENVEPVAVDDRHALKEWKDKDLPFWDETRYLSFAEPLSIAVVGFYWSLVRMRWRIGVVPIKGGYPSRISLSIAGALANLALARYAFNWTPLQDRCEPSDVSGRTTSAYIETGVMGLGWLGVLAVGPYSIGPAMLAPFLAQRCLVMHGWGDEFTFERHMPYLEPQPSSTMQPAPPVAKLPPLPTPKEKSEQ